MIDGDLLYALPASKKGAFLALDKKTGAIVWQSDDDSRAGYAAPVLTRVGDTKAAVVFHGRELVAYDLEKSKGRRLFARMARAHAAWVDEALGSMGARDKRQLVDLLRSARVGVARCRLTKAWASPWVMVRSGVCPRGLPAWRTWRWIPHRAM